MTYNFDPDRWLENELAALDSEFNAGRLDEAEYERCSDRLISRHATMLTRLDGTYQIGQT
ncbi:MAG: hypothetical protein R6W95_10180 [Desulfosarcina sp.]